MIDIAAIDPAVAPVLVLVRLVVALDRPRDIREIFAIDRLIEGEAEDREADREIEEEETENENASGSGSEIDREPAIDRETRNDQKSEKSRVLMEIIKLN